MVGLPRSINPILAFSKTDEDLSTLIYSGLTKNENGKIVPDLAKEYTISDDGLVYNFILKDNLRFHDGTQLTTDDIEFTIQKIQDGDVKSPRRVDWASVIIKKISPEEIQFILKQPYAPFLSNTAVGILPKHIWKNLNADQFIFNEKNLEPIGSGPYKITEFEKDLAGSPTSYTLSAFSNYHNGKPYISTINIRFYQDELGVIDAYKNGIIENLAEISPEETARIASSTPDITILHNPLPRIFALFLNQNNSPVLVSKDVRKALSISVDKDTIIREVLYNYGVAIDGPLPLDSKHKVTPVNKDAARDILAKAGWIINDNGVREKKVGNVRQTLELSITTADSADLKKVAELVKKDWEDIGARVTIKVFEFGDLSQNIIKSRKYDALLFGEIVSKDLDLFAFWHSSQRNSPGLNVSMYVNSKVDKILEDARVTYNEDKRIQMYKNFSDIITDDIPAIFLYSPQYIYIISNKIRGYKSSSISNQSDRFNGIEKWYIETDNVWRIFVNNKKIN
jgi:peptide/nickel transport system substrate-binding protein